MNNGGENQTEWENFWLIYCLPSQIFCLCTLAFKVLTLIHFHLCVHWHFFILVSLVMEDGRCRTRQHHSQSKLGPRPLYCDCPLLCHLSPVLHICQSSMWHHLLHFFQLVQCALCYRNIPSFPTQRRDCGQGVWCEQRREDRFHSRYSLTMKPSAWLNVYILNIMHIC